LGEALQNSKLLDSAEEELGIKNQNLKKVVRFYLEEESSGLLMKQFSIVFETHYDGEFKLNKSELAGGKWFGLDKIDQMIKKDPSEFAPGFLEAYKRYKEHES